MLPQVKKLYKWNLNFFFLRNVPKSHVNHLNKLSTTLFSDGTLIIKSTYHFFNIVGYLHYVIVLKIFWSLHVPKNEKNICGFWPQTISLLIKKKNIVISLIMTVAQDDMIVARPSFIQSKIFLFQNKYGVSWLIIIILVSFFLLLFDRWIRYIFFKMMLSPTILQVSKWFFQPWCGFYGRIISSLFTMNPSCYSID